MHDRCTGEVIWTPVDKEGYWSFSLDSTTVSVTGGSRGALSNFPSNQFDPSARMLVEENEMVKLKELYLNGVSANDFARIRPHPLTFLSTSCQASRMIIPPIIRIFPSKIKKNVQTFRRPPTEFLHSINSYRAQKKYKEANIVSNHRIPGDLFSAPAKLSQNSQQVADRTFPESQDISKLGLPSQPVARMLPPSLMPEEQGKKSRSARLSDLFKVPKYNLL